MMRDFSVALMIIACWTMSPAKCNSQSLQPRVTLHDLRDWREEMPVSMNGKLPGASTSTYPWEDEMETKVWHNAFRVNHQKRSTWKPSRSFEDKVMQELCIAIVEADLEEMKRLIEEEGANVNKIGFYGETALYWAMHVNEDPRPFEMLLDYGADPNVIVSYPQLQMFGRWPATNGYSVTHLSVLGTYNRQFKNVFEKGGDPNLKDKDLDFPSFYQPTSPSFFQLSSDAPDALERLDYLVSLGANLNYRYGKNGLTFHYLNSGQSESGNKLSLAALRHGADPQFYYTATHSDFKGKITGCYVRLIHILAEAEAEVRKRPAVQQVHFRALVDWLEQRGESLAEAKADLVRWAKWTKDGRRDLIEQEHQIRLFHQRQAKAKPDQPDRSDERQNREESKTNETPH